MRSVLLAALIAEPSPLLNARQKIVIARLLNGVLTPAPPQHNGESRQRGLPGQQRRYNGAFLRTHVRSEDGEPEGPPRPRALRDNWRSRHTTGWCCWHGF